MTVPDPPHRQERRLGTAAALDPGALSGLPLFRGLSPEQLSELCAHLRPKSFPAGERVFGAGQPGETIYILLSGSVKVHEEHTGGPGIILAILGSGEVVGEMSLADSLGRSASVSTLEESSFLWMDRANFRQLARRTPILADNLAGLLSRRLRLANAHVRALAILDVPGRVASQLLALAREYGEETSDGVRIPMRLTQSDLAALVGASRVRVNQALGYLRKRNAISVSIDGRITVLDEEALSHRAR